MTPIFKGTWLGTLAVVVMVVAIALRQKAKFATLAAVLAGVLSVKVWASGKIHSLHLSGTNAQLVKALANAGTAMAVVNNNDNKTRSKLERVYFI